MSWHITFGTFATRLHGDARPTVDRNHNRLGTPFLNANARRAEYEKGNLSTPPVLLSHEQREHVESSLPRLCDRGGWRLWTAAALATHVHVVLSARADIHGSRIRPLLKRWLSQELASRWTITRRSDGMSWWAEGGSNKALRDSEYLRNAIDYVDAQRTLPRLFPRGSALRDLQQEPTG